MKKENIDEARILISKRDTLLFLLDRAKRWKDGHFEFTEHCGNGPDRIRIINLPELKERMLDCIRDEVRTIEKRLEEL